LILYLFHFGGKDLYRYTFVSFESLDAVLKFAVICELFSQVFYPYQGIRSLGSMVLRWGGVALLLVALVAAARGIGSDSDRFLAGLFVIARSVEIVQAGLILLLFAASASLGLQWKQEAFAIASGFGLIACVNLAAYTLRVQFGGASTDLLSLIANAGYDCAVLLWLAALWARTTVHKFDRRIPSWDIESWNRALSNMLRQ